MFRQDALEMPMSVFGSKNVMYGSDYLHTIGNPIVCLARVDALVKGACRGWNLSARTTKPAEAGSSDGV